MQSEELRLIMPLGPVLLLCILIALQGDLPHATEPRVPLIGSMHLLQRRKEREIVPCKVDFFLDYFYRFGNVRSLHFLKHGL